MRIDGQTEVRPDLALERRNAPSRADFRKRGTEESNLALRFWRPQHSPVPIGLAVPGDRAGDSASMLGITPLP